MVILSLGPAGVLPVVVLAARREELASQRPGGMA
jgi:hypothetical protein